GAVVTTAPPPTTDGGDAATTPPGPTVPAVGAGGVLDLTLNQGDVAEIVGTPTTDLGGSLLQSDQPVQVISGISCGDVPQGNSACDHLEQTVPPAETLGQDYVVAPMTGPRGDTVGQLVRFFGNADGTTLTYDPSPAPTGCPTTLQAGQVADCGLVTSSFEVKGNHEFVVAVFMPGGSVLDPTTQPPLQEGDPSESFAVPVAQYRADYLFATPEDYDLSFVDVIGPTGVAVTLDNAALTQSFTAIGSGAYGIARVPLQKTTGGRHALVASQPVTIQVMGYGSYTSYQYPGGLNLGLIAPPPTP
ncbi:MAG TPA: IgGFc-binding protein, partial [Polyangiaceae bacterium]